MIFKRTFRVSYLTHNLCSSEKKWWTKALTPGRFCPDCGRLLRKNARFIKKVYTEDKSY